MNLSLETIDQFLCYQFLKEYLNSWFLKDFFLFFYFFLFLTHKQLQFITGNCYRLQENQFKSEIKGKLFEILEKEDDYIRFFDITVQFSKS